MTATGTLAVAAAVVVLTIAVSAMVAVHRRLARAARIRSLLSAGAPLSAEGLLNVLQDAALARAAAPALENARLQAALRRQAADIAAARSRTVRAFLAERRRIEGHLHDGTQAALYEARSQIRRARRQVTDPDAALGVDAAAAALGGAITELRALVRGIYPAGLRETGLGSALFTASAELPLVVDISGDADRGELDETAATAAFFTVMDVLYIAIRSGASKAAVVVGHRPGYAGVRVSYAADRAADENDAWLAAEDRVYAMDGTMRVARAGAEVIVEVELPCAS
jgi:signal transduction histidine kinase